MDVGTVAWVSLFIVWCSPLFDYLLWPLIKKRLDARKYKK